MCQLCCCMCVSFKTFGSSSNFSNNLLRHGGACWCAFVTFSRAKQPISTPANDMTRVCQGVGPSFFMYACRIANGDHSFVY